ncbi:MAG: DUF4040 domain-containing protein [Defluviitaleaceae bacterium]|nr:DUF4040 domain-containing protein [Defluviitaleaceae bacterium]
MFFFHIMLLVFLIVCAVAVSLTKKIVSAIVIFMCYSIVMSVLWLLLESPDLALTEAAVGAGITSVIFFLVVKRINTMEEARNDKNNDRS